MDNRHLPLRPNVCMLLYNKDKKLFLGERLHNKGEWQFPQGGVDDSPTEEIAVIRELNEEIGADESLFKIKKKCKATHQYEFYSKPKYAENRWRGQSQTFWIVEYFGTNEEINISKYEQEFAQYMWCDPTEIKNKTPIYRYKGYEKPIREFLEFIKTI